MQLFEGLNGKLGARKRALWSKPVLVNITNTNMTISGENLERLGKKERFLCVTLQKRCMR